MRWAALLIVGLAMVALGLVKIYGNLSGGVVGPLQGPMLIITGAILCAIGSPPAFQVTSPRGMIVTGAILMVLAYSSPLIYWMVLGKRTGGEEGGEMFRAILWGAVGVPGLVMALVGIIRGLFPEK
ncbi:MAG TPA: hypothetical protein VGL91_23140 [Acidobacteriota bacterium]|jgi:hypothetical protein